MPEPGSPPPPTPDDRDPVVNLADVWETLSGGRWLILGITAGAIALAAGVSALLPPTYKSEAVIRISSESPSQRVLGDLAPLARFGLGIGSGDGIDTDIGVLRSRQIAEAVVDSLHLQVQLLEPKQPRSSVLRILAARRDAAEGIYLLEHQSDGSYTVRIEENLEPVQLPARIAIGAPVSVGGLTFSLAPLPGGTPPERIRFVVHAFPDAVQKLRKEMQVAQPDPRSRLVEVRYRSRDPLLAAAVPNVAAESFIAYKTGTSKSETYSTIEVLREQIAHYEADLRTAEERLQGFREQQQVVSLPEQATQQVRRMAEIQARRDGLQVEHESLGKLLAEVNRGRQQLDGPSPYRRLATFPSFISNRAVQDILHSLIQLENERAQLLVRRTPENVDVRGITERVGELEMQLYQLANNYLSSLDNEIGSANTVLAGFGREIGSIPAREVEFLRLTREQKVLDEIYTFLQTRLKEAEIQEAVDQGDVRVVDPALVPRGPASPRSAVNLVLGAMLGLMLGSTLAVGRRALDPRIRSRKDAVTAGGGLPLLGVIPVLNGGRERSMSWRIGRGSRFAADQDGQERLVMLQAPDSLAAEAYRAIRTHLLIAAKEHQKRILVLTSAANGEGKTVTAANLALSLAQQGTRTLLVDADIRRGGSLHPLFSTSPEPGLVDLLEGRSSLGEAVREVETGKMGTSLHCLFSGPLPSAPAELLGSSAIDRLFEQLRDHYDLVLLDAPSLDLGTDAAVLGRSADATLVVIRAGDTEKEAVQDGISQLRSLGVPAVGLLLNGFPGKVRRRSRRVVRHTAK